MKKIITYIALDVDIKNLEEIKDFMSKQPHKLFNMRDLPEIENIHWGYNKDEDIINIPDNESIKRIILYVSLDISNNGFKNIINLMDKRPHKLFNTKYLPKIKNVYCWYNNKKDILDIPDEDDDYNEADTDILVKLMDIPINIYQWLYRNIL